MLNARIADLLLRWEQLRAQGQTISPEELCRDCPELLDELLVGIRALQTIDSLHGTPRESTGASQPAPTGLPAVGNYQILAELGRGGMGVVYQAYDRKRQEMVALKTLQRLDASSLYRLKQEFRALADVQHPNLVSLYELVSTGQQWFIAMELVDGVHFLNHIRAGAGTSSPQTVDFVDAAALPAGTPTDGNHHESHYALSPHQYDRLRAAFRQLAQGLVALHALGKLHRDIKPSNVMITKQGRVVLMDFGLTAELNWAGLHQSTEQHVTGTIAYMSPEQAASQAVTPASDWYNAGVMLYEALTGRLPFPGTPLQVLMDKQRGDPPPPRDLVAGIPADLHDLCVALLRRPPEERPTGDEVLQRLGNPASAARPRPTQRASFVGRERQLAELTDAFHASKKGRTVVVQMRGRSGAGKSMLGQHFLDDLQQQGAAVVLAGKCYERESVPYKALDSLIDALSRYLRHLPTLEAQAVLPREVHLLARVFPVLQRVAAVADAPGRAAEALDPHDLRRRAFGALRELLARLGDRKPLVLFIDDLQWGDLDGAAQLAELVRPPDSPVLLLLACYRSEDADTSPCLEILKRVFEKAGSALDQRQISVQPLDPDEAYHLARMLLGRDDPASRAQAAAIARESGGNPFFVQVLAESLATVSGPAAITSLEGNLILDEVLWERIQALPDEARRLLHVTAVSGQPLMLTDAIQAADVRADEHAAPAILRSGRLIRSSGTAEREEIETCHDRVRETILSHLPADEVKRLHLRIATALEGTIPAPNRSGENPVVTPSSEPPPSAASAAPGTVKTTASKRTFDLAYHFDAAGASERALPYALPMADQARSQYALEIAEQLYRIAERGAEKSDDATRYRVAESLGDVLMLRGSYPDAAIRFKAALALTADVTKQAHIEGKLAELAFKCGDMKTAIETTERALRMLGNRVPRWSATFLFSLVREVAVQLSHTVCPRLFLERKSLDGTGEQLLTIRLHNRLSYCYWFGRGQIPCLWTHLRGMNLAEQYPPTLELAQAYSIHAPVMHLVARFNRGIAYAQRSFTIYKSLGDLWGQGQSLHFNGIVLHAASRFEECIEKCREAVRLLERTGDFWEVNIAHYHTALSLYRLGDLPAAIAMVRRIYQSGLELGDIQALGVCLDVWVMASGGDVSPEVLRTEIERPRADAQVGTQVLLAEGIRLLRLDHAEEAAVVIEKGRQLAKRAGVKNSYTIPAVPWLASALRRQAEKTPDSHSQNRSVLLKRASKTARQALRTARTFQNDLPHALRECGLIAALQGNLRKARQRLDESLTVAERQGARFEHAQTLLARGRVGQEHGWPEAQADLTTAREALLSLGADFALDDTRA